MIARPSHAHAVQRSLHFFRRLCIAIAAMLALASHPVHAGEIEMVIDGLSFFAFEGTGGTVQLPAGLRIPAKLERATRDSWRITLPAGALSAMPPIRYPSGKSVSWRLSSSASGTLQIGSDGLATITIQAPLVAHVEGQPGGIPFPLTFTTESTNGAAAGQASVAGQRLDANSGVVGLVASGRNPVDAASAPGKPFLAVLTAQLRGLPPDLKR